MVSLPRRRCALAVPLIAAVALAGCGSGGDPPNLLGGAPCGSHAMATYIATLGAAAERIYGQERHGGKVAIAISRTQHYGPLIRAIEAHDIAGVRVAMYHLLYAHLHIVRLRISSAHQTLGDVGGRYVLGPIRAALRDGKRVIGGFHLSIQDDMGYRLLAMRFLNADVVLRTGGKTVMSSLNPGPAVIPDRGQVVYKGRTYEAYSFHALGFPGGDLRISLLFRPPTALRPADSCNQIELDTIGQIAAHTYREAQVGPGSVAAAVQIAHFLPLRVAVATRDPNRAASAVKQILALGHASRVRAIVDGRVLTDNGPANMIAPVAGSFPGLPGTFVLSFQSSIGFGVLMRALTASEVVFRTPTGQLPSALKTGPLPLHGQVTVNGITYGVTSFPAQAFPNGAATAHVLVPERVLLALHNQ